MTIQCLMCLDSQPPLQEAVVEEGWVAAALRNAAAMRNERIVNEVHKMRPMLYAVYGDRCKDQQG